MALVTEELLREITAAIVRAVAPRRILLFGSAARGTATAHSDVDLVVIEDGVFNASWSRRLEMARLSELLAPFPVPEDILVMDSTSSRSIGVEESRGPADCGRGAVLDERP